MSRSIAVGIVAVATLVAVGLLVHLWRGRHTPWSRQDSFTALGLVIAMVGIAVPLLATAGGPSDESPEVHA